MPASWLQGTAHDASPNTNDADASSDGNQDDRTAPVGVVVRTQQGVTDSPNPQNSDGACIPGDGAIAGAPPINFHSPRPQRHIRRPQRYLES